MALTKATLIDLNSNELILDLDADTSITANTDDQIDFRIGGNDILTVTPGVIDLKNDGGTVSKMLFYCESNNAHAQTLIGAPHSEGATNTLTLPGTGGNARLVSTTSTATLTNKTLTSPDINTSIELLARAEARFQDASGGQFVALEAPATVSSSFVLTLPAADGSSGQAIITDGSGALSFTTLSANTPSSADGQALGSASLEWSDLFLADGGTIQFGNDQDVVLTHVADTGLLLSGTNVIQFNDASQNIGAPSATVLDINATDEIELNATLVDVNANLDVSGTVTATGTSVFASLDISGDIDVDGTTNLDAVDIDGAVDMAALLHLSVDADADDLTGDSATGRLTIGAGQDLNLYHGGTNSYIVNDTGDLIIDTAGDIILDAAGTDFIFKDGGTQTAHFVGSGNNFLIVTDVSDGDFKILGNDGGSQITALTLDMSAAGAAEFNAAVTANAGVKVDNITIDGTEIDLSSGDLTLDVAGDIILDADGGDIKLRDGGSGFGQLQNSSSDFIIQVDAQDKDIIFKGDDGGSAITPLRIDMSESGRVLIGGTGATFGELGITGAGNGDANIDMYASVGSGSIGKAEIFFSTDSSSDHVSIASMVAQQPSGDQASRKGEILFKVADNGGPATAVTIQNNKNVVFGGGLAIGGTGTANTLDDYEEGTFTPGTNIGFASVEAEYVKIGSMVHFTIRGTFNAGPGDTSQASSITGLPFTGSPSDQIVNVYVVQHGEQVIGQQGGTGISLLGRDDATPLTRGQIGNKGFQCTGTYHIDL